MDFMDAGMVYSQIWTYLLFSQECKKIEFGYSLHSLNNPISNSITYMSGNGNDRDYGDWLGGNGGQPAKIHLSLGKCEMYVKPVFAKQPQVCWLSTTLFS